MTLLSLIFGLIFTTVQAFFKLPFLRESSEDKRNVFHYEFEGKIKFLFQHVDVLRLSYTYKPTSFKRNKIRSRNNFIFLFEDQDFRPIRYQTGHPISEIDSDIRDFVEEVMPFF